jgi:DUF4097 and DUF4098 domain-containing protein YvlB
MATTPKHAPVALLMLALATTAAAAEKQEFRYQAGDDAIINIRSPFGSIAVRPSGGTQVLVRARRASEQVKVHSQQAGKRIEIRSQVSPTTSAEEGRVDYEVQVPARAAVTVHAGSGPITVEDLRGEVRLESEAGEITVRNTEASRLAIRTISAPVAVANVRNGPVEVSSVGGDIALSNVSGPQVRISTTSGAIEYSGGFAAGGEYTLTTHSGKIEVAVPEEASIDISAQSMKGTVEDAFHFQPSKELAASPGPGHAFAGRANPDPAAKGTASVRVRSFSGNVRVRKQ